MRNSELVSVIIPVFNDVVGVTRTLEGLSLQSWPMSNIEAIIVDNGSEQPITLHAEYPFPTRVVQCETHGSYAARNVGANIAAGTIFAFTDADCVPCEQWLERGIASLIDEEGRSVVGGAVVFSPTRSLTGVAMYQVATGFGQEDNIRDKGFSATANLFCTRMQFEMIGKFDERLLSGGDREWAWRAKNYHVGVKYQAEAIVYTRPRSTLRGAVRQARRVTAGRAKLRKLGLAHIEDSGVARQRSARESLKWILANRDLGVWDKFRVLNVAILIRLAVMWESIRLAMGAQAERR